MKKSVYSLVLMDEVVDAIDQMAYSLGTSRSNLINQILAEKVAFVTPQVHLQNIFNQLSDYLRPIQHFQIQAQAADHMYSIKSALKYKYNPTIRYALYLNHEEGKMQGELRIISRTQSEVLHDYLNTFFSLWAKLEDEKDRVKWQREEGAKWLRRLNLNDFENPSLADELAGVLSNYIKVLDDGLKLFFTAVGEGYSPVQLIMQHYQKYKDNTMYRL